MEAKNLVDSSLKKAFQEDMKSEIQKQINFLTVEK